MEVLKNRNLSVKFQIMVEIASQQPNVFQKDIARKLNLTNQAISEYFQELRENGWIEQVGRSKHRVTREGVAWLLTSYRDMVSYLDRVAKAINDISICTAIARERVEGGQKVGLIMEDGILYAMRDASGPASAIAVTSAERGEDVGVTGVEGIITLPEGKVHIFRVPTVDKGGSRTVDPDRLRSALRSGVLLGCMGLEALVCLRKAKRKPHYFYGVQEAMVEAVKSGLDFDVVISEDYLSSLLARLRDEGIEYVLIDATGFKKR